MRYTNDDMLLYDMRYADNDIRLSGFSLVN